MNFFSPETASKFHRAGKNREPHVPKLPGDASDDISGTSRHARKCHIKCFHCLKNVSKTGKYVSPKVEKSEWKKKL